MLKIVFFSGVPIDDAATFYRAGMVAQKLKKQGDEIIFTSVAGNFQKVEKKLVGELEVIFMGQAHYFAEKPFSRRQRLGVGKVFFENLKTSWRFSQILLREKPKKVIVVTAMPVSLMMGLTAKILGFKTLIDVDDLVVGQMEAAGYPKFLVKVYGFIEKAWVRIFDKVAVCSRYLAERYPGSVILPNMVEVEFWRAEVAPHRTVARFPARSIVFVGQIGPYHGQEEVLENFVGLLKKRQDVRLIFVGGGEKIEDLRRKIQDLRLEKQVVLTGQIPQGKVRDILANAKIGLLPLWDTPVHQARHPLKLLEYLAAGLVVVTNKVGEAEMIIEDGENGLLCPPGNIECLAKKVEMILGSPTLAQKISQKAASSVQEFSVEKIFPRWLNLLEIS